MEITKKLCDFASGLRVQALPDAVIQQTKLFIADYFAASLAGFRVNAQFNVALRATLDALGEKGQASVLFAERKYAADAAAMLNAAYAHGADLDDGNRKSAGHIGASVISAVFACAETWGSAWNDVFVALQVGYEFFNRIGAAAQPSLYQKGFHSTGVVGAVACAAACAKLMGHDADRIYRSVSLAAVQAGGLIIIDESGQSCKPVNPANAARLGIFSAILAGKGANSPINPLESGKGWFHAFSDAIREADLFSDLGKRFTICDSYLKLYPACRHVHSCIDAGIELHNRLKSCTGMSLDDIERIEVYTYLSAIRSAGNIRWPKSVEEAKFSIGFALASALCRGRFELEDLAPDATDEKVRRVAEKVSLIPDDTMEDRENGVRGARIVLYFRGTRTMETTVQSPRGEGAASLRWEDVRRKALACAKGLLESGRVESIITHCAVLDGDARYTYLFAEER